VAHISALELGSGMADRSDDYRDIPEQAYQLAHRSGDIPHRWPRRA
jgi:hypothetical protein